MGSKTCAEFLLWFSLHMIASVSAFLCLTALPLHVSPLQIVYYLVIPLVHVISVVSSYLQWGLLQSLKEIVHPPVVICLSAEGSCP